MIKIKILSESSKMGVDFEKFMIVQELKDKF